MLMFGGFFRYCYKRKKLLYIEVEGNGILEITVTSVFAWALLMAKARTLERPLSTSFWKKLFTVLSIALYCTKSTGKLAIRLQFLSELQTPTQTNYVCRHPPCKRCTCLTMVQEPWLRILGIQPFCSQILSDLTTSAPFLSGQLMYLSLKLALQMFQCVKIDSTNVHIQWAL